ncbi:hydrolase or acyltransferase protein [Ralstonia solanacearum Po82]|uniref:Hydrolase or acyltransferase protein n=1 Tax=Ralstonia solanacearum (strain Po82) TaxID=1031711 RepID=F6G110_RALS8|nr:hydrolase or acyltransferase protein [Ralstonia solanacearum Po82]
MMAPDGPNTIEHYARLIELLSPALRVVCFDMPGFGHSIPAPRYSHALDEGARAILDVLDRLNIGRATLAFSCANGLYAVNAARMAPDSVAGLVLSQTPSLASMQAWVDRTIPWPLRIPVAGQAIAWLFRKKLVKSWYPMALPKGRKHLFRDAALDAMHGGACFCLAGIVQGLTRETMPSADGLAAPCTMIWGGSDPSHRPTDPTSLHQCVPHAEIEIFEECGHFPDVEAPERFAALLRRHVMRNAMG